jgi:5-methylcytosine-specific restriction protein B
MQFKIQGAKIELDPETIVGAVRGVEPEELTKYFVAIEGRRYPVKQALAAASGMPRGHFGSKLARSVLQDLGFDIGDLAPASRVRVGGSTREFAGVQWGLAESEDGYMQATSGKLHLPSCRHGVSTSPRTWTAEEALEAWSEASGGTELRSQADPGWCSDCSAIRGIDDEGPALNDGPAGRAERQAIARAASIVLDRGLRGAASVFDDRTVTWTRETALQLRSVMDEPGGDDSFLVQLTRQLSEQRRAVVLLAAELFFVQRLPTMSVRSDTKMRMIQDILNVLPDAPPVPDVVVDALETRPIFKGGQGYNQQVPQHIRWLCNFIEHWDALSSDDRAAALDDPWMFRARTGETELDAAPVRSALLAMTWPTYFEGIIRTADKEWIRDAFAAALPHEFDLADADRALLALRDRFDPTGQLDIDWYSEPWSPEWRLRPPEQKKRGWVMSDAVPGESLVCPATDFDTTGLVQRSEIRTVALRSWDDSTPISETLSQVADAAAFLSTMNQEDEVFVETEDGIAAGQVGPLSLDRSRSVAWGDVLPPDQVPGSVLDALRSKPIISEVLFLTPEPDDKEQAEAVSQKELRLPRATIELAARLHYDRAWLDDVVDLLEERRQLIFFGPPGTGKTYLARALADFIAPAGAMRIVQFHPSYAYEDFFEGFRPTVDANGTATFRLAPGPVRLLAEAAVANPTVPHVLIIDEINRANIAKVFGELYLLLEYRDAKVSLQYSPEEDFRLPENLFVIGTMNTADRSISLVDAAIRRRFSFVELHPAEEPVRGLIDRWSVAEGHAVTRGSLLRELNHRIGEVDRDFQIGPSYLMGRSARTTAGLTRIWEHDILPLLDEHYYGRFSRSEVREKFGLNALEPAEDILVDAQDNETELGEAQTT